MSMKTKMMETDSVTWALNRTGFFHRVRKFLESNPERLPEILHRTYNKGAIKLDIYGKCGVYFIPRHCSLSVSDMCDRANPRCQNRENRIGRGSDKMVQL